MYYSTISTRDTNSTTYFVQRGYVTTSGTNAYTWYIYNWGDTSNTAYTRLEMTLAGISSFKTSVDNLVPVTNDATNLGGSNLRWKAVYSNSYYLGSTAFGDIVTHNASEFLTSHQDLSLYPYKEISTNNWSYMNLGDTTTYPSGYDAVVDIGKYHIRGTASTPGTPCAFNHGGLLIVDQISTETNVSSYRRCTQIFYRLGAASVFTVFIRRGYYNSGWIWQDWEQIAKTGDIPTKTSEVTNDSGFLSNTLTNNTAKGSLGWNSSIGTNIPTLNTLAYWDGAYNNNTSNLAYCVKGAFGDIVTHNASEFLTSHQSLSNYSTLVNTVKSISISGKTITVTPGSGDAYTLTTQDTVYTHPTTAGNKHIPSGGAANQYLKYSASGTAVWANLPTIPTKTSELTNDSGFLTSHQSLAGYLPLTGGTITGNIIYKRTNATRGTAPSSNVTIQHCDVKDSANNRITLFETTYYTDMSSKMALFAYKTTAATGNNIGSIGIGCTASGTVYTFAPTPAASDDSTQIATTAYVKNQGYLSG